MGAEHILHLVHRISGPSEHYGYSLDVENDADQFGHLGPSFRIDQCAVGGGAVGPQTMAFLPLDYAYIRVEVEVVAAARVVLDSDNRSAAVAVAAAACAGCFHNVSVACDHHGHTQRSYAGVACDQLGVVGSLVVAVAYSAVLTHGSKRAEAVVAVVERYHNYAAPHADKEVAVVGLRAHFLVIHVPVLAEVAVAVPSVDC